MHLFFEIDHFFMATGVTWSERGFDFLIFILSLEKILRAVFYHQPET